eukprot:741597-Rhodomonas_salina.1
MLSSVNLSSRKLTVVPAWILRPTSWKAPDKASEKGMLMKISPGMMLPLASRIWNCRVVFEVVPRMEPWAKPATTCTHAPTLPPEQPMRVPTGQPGHCQRTQSSERKTNDVYTLVDSIAHSASGRRVRLTSLHTVSWYGRHLSASYAVPF